MSKYGFGGGIELPKSESSPVKASAPESEQGASAAAIAWQEPRKLPRCGPEKL
mgnify:CR=1 FL=1